MKKISALLAAFCLALPLTAFAEGYVGNSKSLKFHTAACRAAKRISSAHRVEFENRDAAVEAGYQPCGICRP